MPGNIKVNGIVLSSMPIGEYDKRIVILTKELGKIAAFVRGGRKPNSPLLGISNAFIYGEFELYRGRSSYSVNKGNAKEFFTHVTTDIDNMMLGTYFLEIANYYAQENADEKIRLLLLYRALQVLGAENRDLELIQAVYEFKTMIINGEYPNLFECRSCQRKEDLVALSADLEGMYCSKCASTATIDKGITLNKSTVYALQYVAGSDIKKVFSFELKDDIKGEFIEVIGRFKNKYMNHEFNSASFLKI